MSSKHFFRKQNGQWIFKPLGGARYFSLLFVFKSVRFPFHHVPTPFQPARKASLCAYKSVSFSMFGHLCVSLGDDSTLNSSKMERFDTVGSLAVQHRSWFKIHSVLYILFYLFQVWLCGLCGERGNGVSASAEHFIHTHLSPDHVCDCGLIFSTSLALMSHLRYSHLIRYYVCRVCNVIINGIYQMFAHTDAHPE